MLSNGILLETSLVVASIMFAIMALISQIPTRERARPDMLILIDFGFIPYVAISLVMLFAISALALVNSFYELESLSVIASVILLHCIGLFLPIVAYYCFVLIRMTHLR